MTNREWIAKGKTGCTFATLFAKNPEAVGWRFIPVEMFEMGNQLKENDLIISILFEDHEEFENIYPKWDKEHVKNWALFHGFYVEDTSDNTEGLRIKTPDGVSWVQYFGPDSHIKTRQTPTCMLTYTRKLNTSHYIKVGFNGILHLAHAWSKRIKESTYDLLWHRSYKQTEKILGKKPDIESAAKTTWLKQQFYGKSNEES